MFKELDDKLGAIDKQIATLKDTVYHIGESEKAARAATKAADELQKAFKEHLESVTKNVDRILEPHENLIKVTQELVKTISEIDFPSRLDAQQKEINMLKILLFVMIGLSVIETILLIVLK